MPTQSPCVACSSSGDALQRFAQMISAPLTKLRCLQDGHAVLRVTFLFLQTSFSVSHAGTMWVPGELSDPPNFPGQGTVSLWGRASLFWTPLGMPAPPSKAVTPIGHTLAEAPCSTMRAE